MFMDRAGEVIVIEGSTIVWMGLDDDSIWVGTGVKRLAINHG